MKNTNGWVRCKLDSLMVCVNDKSKQVKSTEYAAVGSYPVVDQSSELVCGYHDDREKLIGSDLPITVFGDHTRHTKYVPFPFIPGADGTQLLKPKKEIDDKFFYYLVAFAAEKIGSYGYDRHFKHLKEFDCYYPDQEPEQTKIAEVLSTLDRAIEKTEAIIAKQQRIKTGLIQNLLTKGIDEHGNIRSEATHEFKDSPLGRIPVEWICQTFEELLGNGTLSDIQDGNHGEMHPKSSDFVPEGVPFVMASDISDGEIDFVRTKKISETQYHSLRIGFSRSRDVLLSHKASIGFVAVVPDGTEALMLTPQVTYYRIGDSSQLSYRYMADFLRSSCFQEPLKSLAKQSTRDYIGILAQRKMHIAYPRTLAEQERIADILNSHSGAIGRHVVTLNKQQFLKIGLMQDLLTGKVRVTPLLATQAAHG